jgi:hypothetical protein
MKTLKHFLLICAGVGGIAFGAAKLPSPLSDEPGDARVPMPMASTQVLRYFDQGLRLLFGLTTKRRAARFGGPRTSTQSVRSCSGVFGRPRALRKKLSSDQC